MSQERVEGLALILHTRPINESDLLIELFTAARGRATVVARGALKSKRRYMGALELGALVRVDYLDKLHALPTLGPCDVVSAPWRARQDLERLSTLYHVLEVARLSAPAGDPDAALFELLVEAVTALEGPEGLSPEALVTWELRLLARLGYALRVDRCPYTHEAPDALSLEGGGAVSLRAPVRAHPTPTSALRTLYLLARGREARFGEGDYAPTRAALSALWGELCGRPLKSAAFGGLITSALLLACSPSSKVISHDEAPTSASTTTPAAPPPSASAALLSAAPEGAPLPTITAARATHAALTPPTDALISRLSAGLEAEGRAVAISLSAPRGEVRCALAPSPLSAHLLRAAALSGSQGGSQGGPQGGSQGGPQGGPQGGLQVQRAQPRLWVTLNLSSLDPLLLTQAPPLPPLSSRRGDFVAIRRGEVLEAVILEGATPWLPEEARLIGRCEFDEPLHALARAEVTRDNAPATPTALTLSGAAWLEALSRP
jgi:DNA repair protein RecO (recombination protein O)